mgnify:CR=1 FL=1|jgi:hypothetical protein
MSNPQHQQPIQVHMINQDCSYSGFSFMFRKGATVRITKRVDDHKNKKSVYQGHYHDEFTGTGTEVQFDGHTLKHLNYSEDSPTMGAYRITLNVDDLDMSNVPATPTF